MSDQSLGSWIAAARKKEGLTQEGLAQRVDCSTAMVSKIESDARVPAKALRDRICETLRLDREEFDERARQGKSKKGTTALMDAIRLGRQNGQRAKEIRRRLEELQSDAKAASDEFETYSAEALNVAASFARAISVITNIPDDFLGPTTKEDVRDGESSEAQAFDAAQFRLRGQFRDFVVTGASGLGAGGAAGAATGVGLYAAVAGFASASTGTAIASLSGAAATNATLAWLGGGALAAGGAGIAGGTAVLVGAVTFPLLAVTATVVVSQGSRILDRQMTNRARLDRTMTVLETNEAVVKTFVKRVTKIGFAVEAARAKRTQAVAALQQSSVLAAAMADDGAEGSKNHAPINFSDLDPHQHTALATLAGVVTSLSALITLPIALKVNTTSARDLALDETLADETDGASAAPQEIPVLDPGSKEENEYVDYAIDRLFAEITLL